jgi:hypothetical protein
MVPLDGEERGEHGMRIGLLWIRLDKRAIIRLIILFVPFSIYIHCNHFEACL